MAQYGRRARRSYSMSANMDISLDGGWMKMAVVMDNLEPSIKAGTEAGQLSAAKKLMQIVKRHLKSHGSALGWPAVSKEYAYNKTIMGGTPSALLHLTGAYRRNIKIIKKGNNIYVGVKKGIMPPSIPGRMNPKLTIAQYASVLETGQAGRNIKARPLWGPSYKQFGGKNRIKKLLAWHISKELRIRTGYSPTVNISL